MVIVWVINTQDIILILLICFLMELQLIPVVAGVVALFLESKPDATSGEVLSIKEQGSKLLPHLSGLIHIQMILMQIIGGSLINRGAASRVLFDLSSDTRPIISGVNINGISFNKHK